MKQVLVTGANRGLGLEHVRYFASRGVAVIAGVRNPHDANDLRNLKDTLPGVIHICAYDALDFKSANVLKDVIGDKPIDLLLANAGDFDSDCEIGHIDFEAFINQIKINALAPLRLAEALIDNVAISDKKLIAFQSSIMGSISLNDSGGHYSYKASKAMLNMIIKNLSNDLMKLNISVIALHPGWVNTRMGGPHAPLDIVESVEKQQLIFNNLVAEHNGCFINYDGKKLSW